MDWDDAYANGAHIPGAADFPPRWAAEAAAFRESRADRAELDLPYGSGARHVFDLFHPDGAARGTMVFVHGGYWRAFDKSTWSHLAAGALARGWAVAMPSYDLCPDVRIADITIQIAQAVETVADRMPGPLTLAGHSAGGHLVARMLAPDLLRAETVERIARVVPISPLGDLVPLMRTDMNDDFRLDSEAARAESPILQPAPAVPVTVWVGGVERPVFIAQAVRLVEAWDCDLHVADNRHHFDVIDPLSDSEAALTTLLTP